MKWLIVQYGNDGGQLPDDFLRHTPDAVCLHIAGPLARTHCKVQDLWRTVQTYATKGKWTSSHLYIWLDIITGSPLKNCIIKKAYFCLKYIAIE